MGTFTLMAQVSPGPPGLQVTPAEASLCGLQGTHELGPKTHPNDPNSTKGPKRRSHEDPAQALPRSKDVRTQNMTKVVQKKGWGGKESAGRGRNGLSVTTTPWG